MLKPSFLAAAALSLATFFAQAEPPAVIDLPQLGNPADVALSPADEVLIGKQVVGELYHYDYILEDLELGEYLSGIGWRLAANGSDTPPPFNFYVIADPRINAFALPGAHIGFNAGTILSAQSESELASVLAHEEAHVTQRHAARGENDNTVANLATWAAVLAAIIAGSANPNLVIGALSLGQGINYNREVSYTRQNEFEADRIGIRTLYASGFDPNAMAGFFSRLEQQTRLYGSQLPEILQTHPVNTTRIAEASERAAQYPTRKEYKDSPEFVFMRARTRVLISDSPNGIMGFYAGETAAHDTPENRYGYALTLERLGRYAEAEHVLEPMLDKFQKQPNVNLLQADVLIGLGRTAEGLAVYDRMLTLYPRYSPAILEYASALVDVGKPEEARSIILSHEQSFGPRIETFKILAQAARASGNTAEAQYQTAEYQYRRGELRSAIEALNAGLRIASITTQDRARLSAKRQELLSTIPREQLERLQRQPG
jgi:predicted Zn-dependent protease